MTRRNKSSTYILNVMQCLVLVFAARVFATAQEFDLRVVSQRSRYGQRWRRARRDSQSERFEVVRRIEPS